MADKAKFKTGDAVFFDSKSRPDLSGEYTVNASNSTSKDTEYLRVSDSSVYCGHYYYLDDLGVDMPVIETSLRLIHER